MPDNNIVKLSDQEAFFPKFDESEFITKKREFARQAVAILIVSSLVIIVIGSFYILMQKVEAASVDDISKFVQSIMSPVVGIVGAVTGFYFGQNGRGSEGIKK